MALSTVRIKLQTRILTHREIDYSPRMSLPNQQQLSKVYITADNYVNVSKLTEEEQDIVFFNDSLYLSLTTGVLSNSVSQGPVNLFNNFQAMSSVIFRPFTNLYLYSQYDSTNQTNYRYSSAPDPYTIISYRINTTLSNIQKEVEDYNKTKTPIPDRVYHFKVFIELYPGKDIPKDKIDAISCDILRENLYEKFADLVGFSYVPQIDKELNKYTVSRENRNPLRQQQQYFLR